MKRLVCLFVALLVCCSMVMPAFAAGGFVPSISYKDGPDAEDAFMQEGSGEKKGIDDCIVVSSIKEAEEKSTDIYQEARDLLLDVYKKLKDGSMKLPLDNEKYVIRELVDVSFRKTTCHEAGHGKDEELKRPEVTATITFDMGIPKNVEVVVLSYYEGAWEEVKSVTNNGDGTVTCVFDHFCPVAFCVEANAVAESPRTGDQIAAMTLWIVLLIVSAAAVVVLLVLRKKKK